MVVSLRNLLVKLKIRWNSFRRSVQLYLQDGSDRCLDLILIGGGIHPVKGPESWKRNCLTLYRLLGFYQFSMSLAKVRFNIQNPEDLTELFASITIVVTLVLCYVKVYILKQHGESIQQLKEFLRSNTSHSSDPDYDASVRQNATRIATKATLAIFFIQCCDQVMVWVPNSARDRILGIPKQFRVLGSVVVCLLQQVYVSSIVVFWGNRYFCTTLTIIPILMELRSELMIVARSYETIEDRVHDQVLNNAEGTSRKLLPNNTLKWKYLKQTLETSVEQHVEVLRNIQLVQPIVNQVYFITFFNVMVVVSMFVFMIIRSELSLIAVVMVLIEIILALECFCWCYITDSIQETMETIAASVAQMGSRLEHSKDNHSEYIQMRTSLMIIQLNASRTEGLFSCGGFFPITVESFTNLCMIIYRYATFLLNFE